ncbi:sensor histidine kinase [Streptomyces sp. 2132.2]|uniref:sensor histidine kinase n=1 Tax=Streptomyces sp. 2132.2 TaxID=2485161 RepID=UPI0011CE0EBD|nr:ATP-binding protein [Streptomyces sp. 2132.2]
MGLQRARRTAVKATGLFRIAHLVVGAEAVTADPVDGRSVALWAGVVAVTVLLYSSALLRGWFRPWWVWCDVLLTGCLLPWVALAAVGEGPAVEPHGWLMVQALSAVAVAIVALGSRGAALSVLLLLLTSLTVYQAVPAPEAAELSEHVRAVVECVALTTAGWWYLRRQGMVLDAAQGRAVLAEAARARRAERTAHHAALHDTVLATLSAIAAGRVDPDAPGLRERCAREAAYVRRLVQFDQEPQPAPDAAGGAVDVGAALEEAVRAAEGLGLRVEARYHAVPAVPPHVAGALAAAVGEALNNVRRHAGTDTAFVTATAGTEDGTVEVTVADRGAGFDSRATGRDGPGTGLRRSVHGRLAGIGGWSRVDSSPGEGTVVELRWPA